MLALDSIDSTNAEALRRINAGDGAGLVVFADHQTSGHGRRGRPWLSGPGNLHASLILDAPRGDRVGQLAFVTAVAAVEAVAADLSDPSRLGVKWPNDLLLDGRKLGGILIEGAGEHCVIGIGINVTHMPVSSEFAAISLPDEGRAVTAAAVLSAFCHAFEDWLRQWRQDGFAPIRGEWLRWAVGLGKPLVARFPDGTSVRGIFRNIDEIGALRMTMEDGTHRSIAAGEVFFDTDVTPDASRD